MYTLLGSAAWTCSRRKLFTGDRLLDHNQCSDPVCGALDGHGRAPPNPAPREKRPRLPDRHTPPQAGEMTGVHAGLHRRSRANSGGGAALGGRR